jgi:hypothetical protein
MTTTLFHLNPVAARWLRAESSESDEGEPPDWDTWLLRRMSQVEVVLVGGILVDRAVLRQCFACVSDRCAPGCPPQQFRSRTAHAWNGCQDWSWRGLGSAVL